MPPKFDEVGGAARAAAPEVPLHAIPETPVRPAASAPPSHGLTDEETMVLAALRILNSAATTGKISAAKIAAVRGAIAVFSQLAAGCEAILRSVEVADGNEHRGP